MMRDENGAAYPVVLIVAVLSLFVIFEVTQIYISEIGFVTEMKDYYEKRIIQLLKNAIIEN
ncbi:hypothetical protein [Lederbergia panacisoli]|uniref:hypothetical protein n=1 Tax=Lederbergia panacisoli TaxID=1255251 RepID=UPI00214D0DDB|nr:hypothetical protein [Lederbergia panacisoli]MCR2820380.1 hypothetical protein [Lederbergia panacisoli]